MSIESMKVALAAIEKEARAINKIKYAEAVKDAIPLLDCPTIIASHAGLVSEGMADHAADAAIAAIIVR